MKRLFLIFLALALLSASAFAIYGKDIDAPSTVFLLGQKKYVEFTVKNVSVSEKDLALDFIGPSSVDVQFVNPPKSIPANSTVNVRMLFKPDSSIQNATYKSTLIVTLGVEEVRKQMNIAFLEHPDRDVEQPQIEEEKEIPAVDSTAFFSFFAGTGMELYLNMFLVLIILVLFALLLSRLMERRA